MRYLNIVIVALILCIFNIIESSAQKGKTTRIEVSSVVKDAQGNPIPRAVVSANEGATIAMTNADGVFSIKQMPQTSLLIEAEGYQSLVVDFPVESTVVMQKNVYQHSSGDFVAVAFGKTYKDEMASTVSNVNTDDYLSYDHSDNFWDMLKARVPGLIGNSNLRGIGDALIIVDGFPRDASSINIEEIDQVSVLKDASAIALYGTQAKNGVILITTKRGEAYKRKIHFGVEKGFSFIKAKPQYLGSAEYMELYNEALQNDGLSRHYSDEQIENYRSGVNPYLYPDVDYYGDEFLKSYRNTTKAVAEFSGGNKNTRYFTHLGWLNNESLVKSKDGGHTNRFNVRGNIDFALGKYVHSHLDAVVVIDLDKKPNGNFWSNAASFHPYYFTPLLPVDLIQDESILETAKRVKGDYILGGTTQYTNNPYGNLYLSGYSQNIYRTSQFNAGIDFDLGSVIKGLQFKTLLSFDFYNMYNQNVTNKYAVYAPTWDDEGMITSLTKIGEDVSNGVQNLGSGSLKRRIGFYGMFDYNHTFAKEHNVSAKLVGYAYNLNENDVLLSHKDSHLGLWAAYNYAHRYYLDFSAVLTHSVKLPVNQRQNISPSATLAWVASNESFWNKDWTVDYLKLSAGSGIILTDMGIGVHQYDASYWYDGSFSWGEGTYTGNITKAGREANPNLSYEKMYQHKIGLEGSMFNHTLYFGAQAFWNKYTDQVVRRSKYYPAFVSVFYPDENYESTSYKGIEASLAFDKRINDWRVKLGANMLFRGSNVDIKDELWQNDYQYRMGNPTDAMFGYVCKGFFADQDDINNSPSQKFGEVKPGDLKYEDLNGDGIIDSNDQKKIGNSLPKFVGSLDMLLQYKGISLYALLNGQFGYNYYNNNSYYWIDGNDKYSEIVRDRWTPETANTATYPRLSSKANDNNFRNSTFWMQNGRYVSLERVQLTYELPYSIIRNVQLKGASLYVRGNNLLMLSTNSRLRSLNIASEPQYRNVVLGINLKF